MYCNNLTNVDLVCHKTLEAQQNIGGTIEEWAEQYKTVLKLQLRLSKPDLNLSFYIAFVTYCYRPRPTDLDPQNLCVTKSIECLFISPKRILQFCDCRILC